MIKLLQYKSVLFLLVVVTITQFHLASSQLKMGFFTDDWLFLSAYRTYFSHPILDLLSGWKALGSHWFPHSYYIGVLYNFLGLNYFAYRLLNQLLKIVATLSLYPLIYSLSRRKFLSFFATLIYGFHFSTFGSLDGPSRGEDFLAIISMNLFLTAYIQLIRKNSVYLLSMFLMSIWLAITVLIDDTRMFPLILTVLIGDPIFAYLSHQSKPLSSSFKRIITLMLPFLLMMILTPDSFSMQLGYSLGRYDKLLSGNWQLFLAPFAAYGSTFFTKEVFGSLHSLPYQSLGTFLEFLQGPLFIFLAINLFLGLLTSRPIRFLTYSLSISFLLDLLAYWLSHHWLGLDKASIAPVDPGTYLTPAIFGLNLFASFLTSFIFWFKNQKDGQLLCLFLCSIFSLGYIFLTWIFADINSIFMGVHPYLNLPAIGTSISLGIITTLVYDRFLIGMRLRLRQPLIIIIICLLLSAFYLEGKVSINNYFSHWLNNGLAANDQIRIIDKFWQTVQYQKNQPIPVIYLDAASDYNNGTFYSEVMIWKISAWFDVKYNQPKEGRYSLCDLMILDKVELEKSVKVIGGDRRLVRDKCGPERIYSKDEFYAFKLLNRDIIPSREEVLEQLGITK